jgi:metal-responsive CopG/Arc/MetJ family transcriptional regulator
MTKALIDIPDHTLKQIDAIAATEGMSRAALVRLAMQAFIDSNKKSKLKNAFGILKKEKIDGLLLEKKLRSEW